MRNMIVTKGNDAIPTTMETIFNVSDLLGRESQSAIQKILMSNQEDNRAKVEKIMKIKEQGNKAITDIDIDSLLKNSFTFDGGIKLSEADVEDILGHLNVLSDGEKPTQLEINEDHPYIMSLCEDFLYFRGQNVNFRNHKYYFLFDSLKVVVAGSHAPHSIPIATSINDYTVTGVDFPAFQKDVFTHFNRIDQHLKLFLEFFAGMTVVNIVDNFEDFERDVLAVCSPKKLKFLEESIKESKGSPDDAFNQKVLQSNLKLLKIVHKFLHFIELLSEKKKTDTYIQFYGHIQKAIVLFLATHSSKISQIKNVLGIDINKVLRKYAYAEVPVSHKKLILGLLDAKINILAFMQNITQILYSKNFLDPDFEGDLVLSKDQVAYMKKMAPDIISRFKDKQSEVVARHDTNSDLAMELEIQIGYYNDILIGDKPESYLYATTLMGGNLKEIHEGYDETAVELFVPTFDLLGNLLEELEIYGTKLDGPKLQKYKNELERNRRKRETGRVVTELEPFIAGKNKNYLDAKEAVFKKLFRLHREENNPLVMIKTAQNAYTHIFRNGFDVKKDILHILSVNYGGSLVGYYAKHIFERMEGSGRVLVNLGNIIYSIYDLKNANDFLGMVDYPFNEYAREFSSDDMQKFFQEQNQLLIFDDNTSSGRTLNNLHKLSSETHVYGKIDIFACRASSVLDLYDDNVSPEMRLHLISNAALETRKTRIGTVKRGYKELVGAYIGNSLYKSGYRGQK